MKRISLFTVTMLMLIMTNDCSAASRISKVLPHLLDKQGLHTLSPSLLERDAYQAQLRSNPDQCSGIRFDVKWSNGNHKTKTGSLLKVQVELQTSASIKPIVLSQPIKLNRSGGWDSLKLDNENYKTIGKIIGWRVLLLEDGKVLAERRSFLWQTEKTSKKSERPSPD